MLVQERAGPVSRLCPAQPRTEGEHAGRVLPQQHAAVFGHDSDAGRDALDDDLVAEPPRTAEFRARKEGLHA